MGPAKPISRSAWTARVLALAIATGACGGSPSYAPPAGSSESYTLGDFEIAYPYDDPRPDVGPWDDQASVLFTVDWPRSGFPGYANCVVTLEGRSGDVVGDLRFQLISGTDGARGEAPMIVPVSDEAAAASGSCTDEGSDDSLGSGYFFTGPTRIWAPSVAYDVSDDITGSDAPPLSQVEFDVLWEQPGKNPGMRTCYLYVTRADGTEDPPARYGMLTGEGRVVFDVRGEPDSIASARVTCGPLEE
jgi:hypothetical protein